MNKSRRTDLEAVRAKVAEARVIIEQANASLELVREAEQDAFDALPESLQDGERGEKMAAALEAIDQASDELDTMAGELGDLDEVLQAAAE